MVVILSSNELKPFNYDEVTEEEIIKGAIESNIAVFLHGQSSEGKTSRVKELDPNCEIVYLRNASVDSFNGKSVYVPPMIRREEIPVEEEVFNKETGEKEKKTVLRYQDVIVEEGHMLDVKPSWLIKLERKCMEEPDKLHIVFFDEITNALHTVQGMAFNVVYDHEVNGKWYLPENARIVAAGNEMKDSVCANTMPEPLFNRFAHVYIETKLDEWLEWAVTPKKSYQRLDYIKKEEPSLPIHPMIYSFILCKSKTGVNVLRTKFTGIKPNADPRKWEMASKMLYETGKPEMLRSLVGEGITKDFISFCNVELPTLDMLIHDKYKEKDYNLPIDKKYAVATRLAIADIDEQYVGDVRNFVKKMGLELLTLYDDMWIREHPDKKEKIKQLRLTELNWG